MQIPVHCADEIFYNWFREVEFLPREVGYENYVYMSKTYVAYAEDYSSAKQ